jgi:hypothetical protein
MLVALFLVLFLAQGCFAHLWTALPDGGVPLALTQVRRKKMKKKKNFSPVLAAASNTMLLPGHN